MRAETVEGEFQLVAERWDLLHTIPATRLLRKVTP
jgi:hypothetical protein